MRALWGKWARVTILDAALAVLGTLIAWAMFGLGVAARRARARRRERLRERRERERVGAVEVATLLRAWSEGRSLLLTPMDLIVVDPTPTTSAQMVLDQDDVAELRKLAAQARSRDEMIREGDYRDGR